MSLVLAVGIVRRCRILCCRTTHVIHRTLAFSRVLGYKTTSIVHAAGPPLTDSILSADYGKYHMPGKFETFYQWFAESSLVQGVETGLSAVHDFTGLPWWASIIVCTVVLRSTITAPLFVWQMQKMIKYRMLTPVLEKISQRLTLEADDAAKKNDWDEKTRNLHLYNSFYKHKKQLFAQNKVPGTLRRHLLPWVQLPVWFSLTAALRYFTLSLPFATSLTPLLVETSLAFSKEGMLWFFDLCAPDSYYILPVLLGLVNLAIIEVHRGDGKAPLVVMQWFLINFVRVLSVLMVPVACYMPTGVVLYWLTSSSFGLAQALALQSVKFKKFLRIPVPINHSKTPYRDILSRFKMRRADTSGKTIEK